MPKTKDRLKRYREKRNFKLTPEPSALGTARPREPIFVIQKHAASRLHYDFRLEAASVLKSWAVPKGPSTDPKVKRLAVPTEDHPIPYAKFEGVIPAGEYGGGNVIVWDRGTYENKTVKNGKTISLEEGIERGHITVEMKGEKVKGGYALTRIGGGGKPAWLLVKIQDDAADPAKDLEEEFPASIVSGRTVENVSGASRRAPKEKKSALKSPTPVVHSKRSAMPTWIPPMLATLNDKPFSNPDWIFEPKLDGQRILAYIDKKKVALYSRSQRDDTVTYPEIVDALRKQSLGTCILDGEVVAFAANGKVSSFSELQNRMHLHRPEEVKRSQTKVFYYVFDILYLDGKDLRRLPLTDRRKVLEGVLSPNKQILLNPVTEGDGEALYRQAKKEGWEGVIAKAKQSPYVAGRSREWLKLKCVREQEFIIGGYTDPQGARDRFGALLIGYYDGDVLNFAGKVGTGFDVKALDDLSRQLKPLRRPTSPFESVNLPRRGLNWVEPRLVAQIGFGEWTNDGKLRHPRYIGLRDDKKPADVTREEPKADTPEEPKPMKAKSSPKKSSAPGKVEVDGNPLVLSHLDKVLYLSNGFTKGQVLDYYTKISAAMLPYLKGRPVTMKRYPNGVEQPYFYEKRAPSYRPDWLDTYDMKDEKSGHSTEYGIVNKLSDLLWMANLGTLEFHVLLAQAPNVERPTTVAFDFDPGPSATFVDCAKIALQLRDILKSLKLKSVLKTSGGKGLHLYVPLNTKTNYTATQEFAHAVALTLEKADPKHITSTMRKEFRTGKVLIDWSQNSRHKTTVCAYSLRATKVPGVSTPVEWSEIEDAIKKKSDSLLRLSPADVLARVKRKDDLFSDALKLRQTLPMFNSKT